MNKESSVFDYKKIENRKNVPYELVGDKFKIKVADMDALINQIREERRKAGMNMIIQVKAIRIKREKEISKTVSYAKDPATDIYYGIIAGILGDGNVKWRRIFLTDFNQFNLDNDLEAKCYATLRMHPALAGSPFETTEEPMFEILDKNHIANEKFSKAMKVGQALHIIKTMKEAEVSPFARFMDLKFEDSEVNTRVLKASLCDIAEQNPDMFIRNYNDPNRKLFEMVALGKYHGIITFNPDKGHTIGSTFLGYSAPDVVTFLDAQTEVAARLRAKLQQVGADVSTEKE